MEPFDPQSAEARRRAQERLAKSRKAGPEAMSAELAQRQAQAANTNRLRALRLAKEAADREAALRASAEAAARPRSARPAPAKGRRPKESVE